MSTEQLKASAAEKIRDAYAHGDQRAKRLAITLADLKDALEVQEGMVAGLKAGITRDAHLTIGALSSWDIGRTVAFEWKGTYMRARLDSVHGHYDRIIARNREQGMDFRGGPAKTSVDLVIGGHHVDLIDPTTPCEVIA
ncbi:hypothetical protein Bra3105_06680 [Brachybacterium halotolerans subsp. kimchii]|uniref:hypothetical protein n=1 Tax=Brachybacterium halotolerans TaxID=2795215 RepID=UPI001E50E81F|nr:hypothetical protein [Brachybacterium halotolerans]UEJ83992.1 hypothetical protein Bra3105_06680 [Brachybacterium halotolerans subsp. kimchii]